MRLRKTLSIAIFAIASISPLFAADAPKDPSRQTSWGLYVDSREAYQMKTGERGTEVLFVDVRDPIEIMFTGFTDVVDVNVPYMSSNRQKWNDKKNVYAMEVNPAFEAQIAKALADRKLSKDSPVVLMCRSGGERGAPSAKMLEGKGYKQVYVVTDGFEGDTVKDGDKKNWRLVNGWKNSGLPWGYTLNKAKVSQD
jgi:rhodanese-related sulfurtransferase